MATSTKSMILITQEPPFLSDRRRHVCSAQAHKLRRIGGEQKTFSILAQQRLPRARRLGHDFRQSAAREVCRVLARFPELQSRVDAETNEMLVDYMQRRGIEDGYWQEPDSATDLYIPDFDLTGVEQTQRVIKRAT